MTANELQRAAQALRHKAANDCNKADYRREYLAFAQAIEFVAGTGSHWLAATINGAVREYDHYVAEVGFSDEEAAAVNSHGARTLEQAETRGRVGALLAGEGHTEPSRNHQTGRRLGLPEPAGLRASVDLAERTGGLSELAHGCAPSVGEIIHGKCVYHQEDGVIRSVAAIDGETA